MKRFLITSLLLAHSLSSAFDMAGLQISLAGDMIYEQGINKDSNANDKMTMRGAEMMFFAPLDHRFDGILSAAAHDEDGETVFELHELYFSSSKIIPRSRFKVGKFFLGVGRLNQIHQHDWAFMHAPKVQEEFFDEEGLIDTGVEFGHLFNTQRYLDLTIGVTSGHTYGHAHTDGKKPKVPTHYLSLKSFTSFNNSSGIQYGLNYVGRTDGEDNQMMIPGFEVVAKWREGKIVKYLFQSETWYRNTKDAQGAHSEQLGLYIYNQMNLSSETDLGFRVDLYKDLSKRNSVTGKKVNNIEYNFAPEFTWRSSEFVKMRLGLSHSFAREEGMTLSKDTRATAQFVFILGAHPAHSF